MCFSCRYSSVVSLSTTRPHPKKGPRDLSLVSLQSETSRPVSAPLLDSSIMTVRGMRRIQASKSAALRCLVIGPSFFGPSKYTVGTKEEGAAAVDARRRTWLATHGSLGHLCKSPVMEARAWWGQGTREEERKGECGKKARTRRCEHLTFMTRNIVWRSFRATFRGSLFSARGSNKAPTMARDAGSVDNWTFQWLPATSNNGIGYVHTSDCERSTACGCSVRRENVAGIKDALT